MNKITIELCAEDRARLDNILIALQARAAETTELKSSGSAPILAQEPQKEAEPSNTTPEPEKPQEAPKMEPTAPSVTLEQIQQKAVQLAAAADKKTKVREIINQYAPKVSALPEDKLVEVWQQLTALEKEG